MTFLITVSAVIVGCLLYDLIMNTYMKFRMKRMAKKLGGLQEAMQARLEELQSKATS